MENNSFLEQQEAKRKQLIEELKNEKQRLLSLCPFKKGDILEWEDYKGKMIKGRFDRISVYDDLKIYMIVNLPETGRIGWSSSNENFINPDYSKFKIVENNLDKNKIDKINNLIENKESEIFDATRLLKRQLRKLEEIRKQIRKDCIHEWGRGWSTGEYDDNNHEYHEYTCKHCNLKIKSS